MSEPVSADCRYRSTRKNPVSVARLLRELRRRDVLLRLSIESAFRHPCPPRRLRRGGEGKTPTQRRGACNCPASSGLTGTRGTLRCRRTNAQERLFSEMMRRTEASSSTINSALIVEVRAVEAESFDTWTRLLGSAVARRGVLGAAGLGVTAAAGVLVPSADAKKKKKASACAQCGCSNGFKRCGDTCIVTTDCCTNDLPGCADTRACCIEDSQGACRNTLADDNPRHP